MSIGIEDDSPQHDETDCKDEPTEMPVDDSVFAVDIPDCPIAIDVFVSSKGGNSSRVISAVGATDNRAYVYSCDISNSSIDAASHVCIVEGHEESVAFVKLTSQYLITAGLDDKVKIWKLPEPSQNTDDGEHDATGLSLLARAALVDSVDTQAEPLDMKLLGQDAVVTVDASGVVTGFSLLSSDIAGSVFTHCLPITGGEDCEYASISVLENFTGSHYFLVGMHTTIALYRFTIASRAFSLVGSLDLVGVPKALRGSQFVTSVQISKLQDESVVCFVGYDEGVLSISIDFAGKSKSALKVSESTTGFFAECLGVSSTGALVIGCHDSIKAFRAKNLGDALWNAVTQRSGQFANDMDYDMAVTHMSLATLSSGQGVVAYTLSGDDPVYLIDLKTGAAIKALKGHDGDFQALSVRSIGNSVLVGTVSDDQSCRLFIETM